MKKPPSDSDEGRSEETSSSATRQAERRLFRQAMQGVKRSRPVPAPPQVPKPRARARFARLDEAAVLAESLQPQPGDLYIESGEAVAFRRARLPEAVLHKLQRGQYRVEAEIDLHGLNAMQAKEVLRDFLQAAHRAGTRCVRVIHGKGHRSGHRGPVLKSSVQLLLQKVDSVLAYASARPMDGGTGAMYVLLNPRI